MYHYQISPVDKLVCIKAHGDVDLDSSRKILTTVVKDREFQPDYDLLIDVRDMTAEPPARDLQAFADFLGTIAALRGRFAVVASAGLQFGMGRVICSLAQLRNIQMLVFHHEAAARAWLKSNRS